MKRYCLALDLKEDENLIKQYVEHHTHVHADIVESITSAGITIMDIYRTGNRLFMIMEVTDDFDFATKDAMDAANPKVQEWEALVGGFQQNLPWAKPGEKWVLMEQIYSLPKE